MRTEAAASPPPAGARSRARLAGSLVLVALLPLLVLAWIAAVGVGRSETRAADLRLEAEARSAAAAFVGVVGEASSRAASLTSTPAFQRALAARDRDALRRLVRDDDVVVSAAGHVLVGVPVARAAPVTVNVVVGGRALGAVTVPIPLNRALLDRLRRGGGVGRRDRLALVQRGRAVAGAVAGPAAVPIGIPVERRLDGTTYRVYAARLADRPHDVRLLTLTPRSAIAGGVRDRLQWTILAILVTLATVAAGGFALAPLLRGRGGAIGVFGDRRDGRALTLVGDALASTHDPERLLPVILHATMGATGAVAGRVVKNGRVTAEEGNVAGAGRSLRLALAGEPDGDEVALELWPPAAGFDQRTRAHAQSLAAQAAIALENARLHRIVQRQAMTDELTELANRRHFLGTLETELRRAERFDEPLSVMLADVDDFKLVNDRFGHDAGDKVLRAFADVVRGRVRTIDLAARLGGEEFAFLLVETNLTGAQALAESLRAAVEALEVEVADAEVVRVTASFGVAAYPQTHTAGELLGAADRALYSAKREGKNRVSVRAARTV